MSYTSDPKVIAVRLALRALPVEAGKCTTYNCHTPYARWTANVPERVECPNCGAWTTVEALRKIDVLPDPVP